MHGQKQDSEKYSVSTLFSYHDRQSYVIRSGKDLNRLNNIEKSNIGFVHRQAHSELYSHMYHKRNMSRAMNFLWNQAESVKYFRMLRQKSLHWVCLERHLLNSECAYTVEWHLPNNVCANEMTIKKQYVFLEWHLSNNVCL